MSRKVKKNTASKAIFRIFEGSDPKTGVTSSTTGLLLWYKPIGGTRVTLSLTGLTETGGGEYELPIPAEAYLSTDLSFGGELDGCVVVGEVHEVVGYDKLNQAELTEDQLEAILNDLGLTKAHAAIAAKNTQA